MQRTNFNKSFYPKRNLSGSPEYFPSAVLKASNKNPESLNTSICSVSFSKPKFQIKQRENRDRNSLEHYQKYETFWQKYSDKVENHFDKRALHAACAHDEKADNEHESALEIEIGKSIEQKMMRAKMFSEFKNQNLLDHDCNLNENGTKHCTMVDIDQDEDDDKDKSKLKKTHQGSKRYRTLVMD